MPAGSRTCLGQPGSGPSRHRSGPGGESPVFVRPCACSRGNRTCSTILATPCTPSSITPKPSTASATRCAGRPANPGFHLNLGNALRVAGRVGEAIQSLRHALELQPDFAEAHWDLAFALLLQGDFTQGFQEYEWRWRRRDFPRRQFASPLWLGEDLAGRTLLVHAEQGAGDGIQFVRFVGDLAERGARVLLECPPSLAALFESVAGAARVIPRGAPLPDFDCHVPLLSLPHRSGSRLKQSLRRRRTCGRPLTDASSCLRPAANKACA